MTIINNDEYSDKQKTRIGRRHYSNTEVHLIVTKKLFDEPDIKLLIMLKEYVYTALLCLMFIYEVISWV